jgi:two-component system, LytTR family, sensor kinase
MKMVRATKYKIGLHLFVWLSIPFALAFILWAYQFTAFPLGGRFAKSYWTTFADFVETNILILTVGPPVFYAFSMGLLPAIGRRKGRWANLLMYGVLILLLPWLVVELFSRFSLTVGLMFSFFLLTAYILLIPALLLGTLSWAIRRSILANRLKAELETKQIRTELELLRSQTNPHFLCNTINNIDALIRRDPALASEYLNELSDLLRFILYESAGERISLQDEITCMRKYIALQRIRSVNPDFIHFTVSGDPGGWQIAPMLLMPVLENAFKHVSGKTMDKAIDAELRVDRQSMAFRCKNMFNERATQHSGKGGLGTHLLKQRLDLIYKDNYQLEAVKSGNWYQIELKIDLHAH